MFSGMYTIANAMDARFRAQDLIAHNISHSQTLGFRRQMPVFTSFGSALGEAVNGKEGAPLPGAVQLQPQVWDLRPGPLQPTGRDLDFAIRGNAFFLLESPNGEKLLSRDGHFTRDQDDNLVTHSGLKVLGESGPIQLPPKGDVSLTGEGELVVDGENIDAFKLAAPQDPRDLMSVGGGLFRMRNPEAIETSKDSDALKDSKVEAGMVEGSNVNPSSEMVMMIQNTRMAEMSTRALQMVDGVMATAVRDLIE